jgi:hypothetical protein
VKKSPDSYGTLFSQECYVEAVFGTRTEVDVDATLELRYIDEDRGFGWFFLG